VTLGVSHAGFRIDAECIKHTIDEIEISDALDSID
jgi:hypothetical protein